MIDETGKKVWEETFDFWGKPHDRLETRVVGGAILTNVKKREETTHPEISQPFRFPGQYHDEETGLYYNRFRYYLPGEGMYTQRDPIGLSGGNPTVYGYVFNTLKHIDPLGLKICSNFNGKRGEARAMHDLKRNGFNNIQEQVSIKVNGQDIIADFVATDGHGRVHVFEAKFRSGRLTPNQRASGAFPQGRMVHSNTSRSGGGTIRTSMGRAGSFDINGSRTNATFHLLRYR